MVAATAATQSASAESHGPDGSQPAGGTRSSRTAAVIISAASGVSGVRQRLG